MAVVSIKNKLRRGNLLVGNDPYIPTDFESIATVTVGSGGAANVEFTSIPGTYTHLQIRYIARSSDSGNYGYARLRFNSDTGSNYSYHYLQGDGASATAGAASSEGRMHYFYTTGTADTNRFAPCVADILDYKDTNKYKTVRWLSGWDVNGAGGYVEYQSGLWQSTSAITSIKFDFVSGASFQQYTHFALYGIKVAS
jgi:hypothetical protein